METAQIDAQAVRRKAQRIGFGLPTVGDAGMGKKSVEFHLPDNPPKTLSRPIASSIILEEGETLAAATVRFPQAPPHMFDQDQVVDAAEAALEAGGFSDNAHVRLNPVIENEHAAHIDSDRPRNPPISPEDFLEKAWVAGETFNEELERLF